ncbi:hypothetical protein GAO09_15580 [Rhizobiales bacterium RZME27]|uniref:Uncharacterized protein n=1 Tax=Endobacterium cereale TaxID=2663029 RepID=A0A6A8A870_9HYPH|nr:hypothetical protein [Endobacterium cereale]MEB2847130.1 hypothetical protein [Endobacterium cereale]MQY47455.1 hypothetical protein [Endobacterium cereale]
MQTLFLIALGFVSGSAILAGCIYTAVRLPGVFRKPRLAAPLGRSDKRGDANGAFYAGPLGNDSSC